MLVVPTECIFSKTAQELLDWESAPVSEAAESRETYHVFAKPKHAGTQTLLGQVEASSPEQALQLALERYKKPAFAWWVFPARLALSSQVEDIPSLYAPAREKNFRLSTDYKTITAMRELRQPDKDG